MSIVLWRSIDGQGNKKKTAVLGRMGSEMCVPGRGESELVLNESTAMARKRDSRRGGGDTEGDFPERSARGVI